MKERRHDIDWLRVIAIVAVFFLHSSHFFDTGGWHLKNVQQSFVVDIFRGLIDAWAMELLFLLSGVGTWYALKSRNAGQYLFERVKRLLIPLYTLGAFILLPPQAYFDRGSRGQFFPAIWKLMPPYWDGHSSFRFRFDTPYLTNIWPGHLWFLQFLFSISLVTLPLLLLLRTERGQRLIGRLAGWCDRWGGITLLLMPMILVQVGVTFCFIKEYPSWNDLLWYLVFFVIGYLIPADSRFTDTFKRHGWVCLPLGLVCYYASHFIAGEVGDQVAYRAFSSSYVLIQSLRAIGKGCTVVFMLSLGARYLKTSNKLLAYANEAVLPFYLLHQTIILTVGWFVIRWPMGIVPKFLIISAISFPLIVGIYELFVKRFNVVRFFFGMRPRKHAVEESV